MLPSPQNLCLTLWLYIWLYMVILLYRFLNFEFLIIWRNNQFQCKWTKRLGCSFSLQIIVSWFPTELANVFKRLLAWRLVCIFFSRGESFFFAASNVRQSFFTNWQKCFVSYVDFVLSNPSKGENVWPIWNMEAWCYGFEE